MPTPWDNERPFHLAWDGEAFVLHWLELLGGAVHAARWLGDSWERLPIEGYSTRTLVDPTFTSAADSISGRVGFLSWRDPLHLFVHDRGGVEIFTRNIPVERAAILAYPALGIGQGRIAVATRTLDRGTVVLEMGPDSDALGAEGWIAEDGSANALSGNNPELRIPPYRLLRITEPRTTQSIADEFLGVR